MSTKIISAILVLALIPLASLACGFTVNLPERPQPGPDVEESITVPDPKSDSTRLTISFGAGKLNLSPGTTNLVDGTAVYNFEQLKPEIITDGSNIEIKQGDFKSLPSVSDLKNDWDLKLGKSPMDLTIQAGAYDAKYEFGGLALKSLTVRDGASRVSLSFSEPNQAGMSLLRYETGASNVTLSGLANANFSTLLFSGGAGSYKLDFSGDLQRDATITIEAGFGDMNLVIPKGVNANLTVEGAALDINHSSSWSQSGRVYTQQGEGPTLTIIVKMAAGTLSMTD